MRIAFFGSSHFSCLVLSKLLASRHEIACVVTQPDQPAGRSMALAPTEVALLAREAGLRVLRPVRLRGDEEFEADLRELEIESLLVASYGQILPRPILKITPWPLNVHPSLLPELRGASPIRTALLQGLGLTGCCIMRMTPRLDDGDVLLREELAIGADWNYARLEDELGALGGQQAVQALDECESGTVTVTAQEETEATYCGTYKREDTVIDWTRSAVELHNFIRAWDPDLGALTTLGGKRLKVWRAEVTEGAGEPGGVLKADRKELLIAAGSGTLGLLELQPENKRRMSVAEFLAGNRIEPGAQFGS